MTKKQLLAHHLENGHVSLDDHLREMAARSARKLECRRRLYLDTKYWVYIRDALLERPQKPEHPEILEGLRRLVASGKAICPVSDVAFAELASQSDDETRTATALLLDELSLGTALRTEEERFGLELTEFLTHPEQATGKVQTRDAAWTAPCFTFGVMVPTSEDVSPEVNLAVQKATIDELWSITFAELASDSTAHLQWKEACERTAKKINADVREFASQATSFKVTFKSEVVGGLSAAEHVVRRVALEDALRKGLDVQKLRPDERERLYDLVMRILVNSFDLARTKMALRMPTTYVHAACHAAIRLDRQRKFDGNFLRDLHHGAAATPYFDAMFTEKTLRILLTAGNVAADKTFGCHIVSKDAGILDYLSQIG